MSKQQALSVQSLKAQISLSHLNITTSADLEGSSSFLGQDRAKKALEFGIAMDGAGYNLFVMGDSGTGRLSLVSNYVKQQAQSHDSSASDICFVNHFEQPREPYYLELPAGLGTQLNKSITDLIEELLDTFPAAFENPSYQRKRTAIDRAFNQKYDLAMSDVEKQASLYDVAIVSDGGSILLLPIVGGRALDDTEFAQLEEQVKSEFQQRISELEVYLNEQLLELPTWKRESSEQLRSLNNETIAQAIKPIIRDIEHQYQSHLPVLKYIRNIKQELPKIIIDIFSDDGETSTEHERKHSLTSKLMPNLIVQHKPDSGIPVNMRCCQSIKIYLVAEYNTQQSAIY